MAEKVKKYVPEYRGQLRDHCIETSHRQAEFESLEGGSSLWYLLPILQSFATSTQMQSSQYIPLLRSRPLHMPF